MSLPVVVWLVCILATASSGTLDLSSLIQRDSQVVIAGDGSPEAADSPDITQVSSLATQIPSIPGLTEVINNMSMAELQVVTDKLLRAMSDKAFAERVNATLLEMIGGAANLSKAAASRVGKLEAAGKSLKLDQDASQLLLDFLRKEREEVYTLVSFIAEKVDALQASLPPGSEVSVPGMHGEHSVVKIVQGQLGIFYDRIDKVTKANLCEMLEPMVRNMSTADAFLSQQVIPVLGELPMFLPRLGQVVRLLKADVENTIVDLANMTISLFIPVTASFQQCIHDESDVIAQIAKVQDHCALDSGSTFLAPGLLVLAILASPMYAWAT